MVAAYKGFGDRYVYIPPCLRKDMSRQSPTPDFDNMTDDEMIAFFDEIEAVENHKWSIEEEE